MNYKLGVTTSLACFMLAQGATASEEECDTRLSCIEADYDTKTVDPVKLSSLKLVAGVQNDVSFNDNIFRSRTGEESDVINRLSPQLRVSSDFDKHELSLRARAENGVFFSNSENNYTDADIDAAGRFDINDVSSIYGGGGYSFDHVTIGSFVDDPSSGSSEPTLFHNASLYTGYQTQYNDWHYDVRADWNLYNYQNVERRDGTTNIQNDRDRSEYMGTATVGYDLHDDMRVYVRGAYERRVHDERIDSSSLFTRNSEGQRVLIGLIDDNKDDDGFVYDVGLGYLKQDYNARELPDVTDFDAYADARWFVSDDDTLRFRLDRRVRDAYSTGVSAYLQTRARVNYAHQYNGKLELGAGVNYARNDFETNTALRALDREDDVIGIHLWGEYEVIDDLDVNLYYLYNDRDSNESRAVYEANIVGTALSYKY